MYLSLVAFPKSESLGMYSTVPLYLQSSWICMSVPVECLIVGSRLLVPVGNLTI